VMRSGLRGYAWTAALRDESEQRVSTRVSTGDTVTADGKGLALKVLNLEVPGDRGCIG